MTILFICWEYKHNLKWKKKYEKPEDSEVNDELTNAAKKQPSPVILRREFLRYFEENGIELDERLTEIKVRVKKDKIQEDINEQKLNKNEALNNSDCKEQVRTDALNEKPEAKDDEYFNDKSVSDSLVLYYVLQAADIRYKYKKNLENYHHDSMFVEMQNSIKDYIETHPKVYGISVNTFDKKNQENVSSYKFKKRS